MWLFVNSTRVLEVTSDPTGRTVPCKTIDLSPAATPGQCSGLTENVNTLTYVCIILHAVSNSVVFSVGEYGEIHHM